MDTLQWIAICINTVGAVLAGLWLKSYLPTYFSKKAENLATKEDIADITDKVEGVKSQYQSQIETLRAKLDKGKYAHQRQYDLELEVYKSLWKELVELREATASLRPVMDSSLGDGETEEDRKRDRGKRFFDAFTPLGKTIEQNRPFYSPEVWAKVHALRELAWKEALDYRFSDPDRDFEQYWGKAEKNLTAIKEMSDDICDSIRLRINHLNEA